MDNNVSESLNFSESDLKNIHSNTDLEGDGIQSYKDTDDSQKIEVQVEDTSKTLFASTYGQCLTCMGSAVGMGNVWRYSRIIAAHSGGEGSLTFILIWIFFLFSWSIPIILVEYAIGRFTKNSPVAASCKFLGRKFLWVGGWMMVTITMISAYYPVIIGWCLYYLWISISVSELPATREEGTELFFHFTQNTYWPTFFQILAVLLSGALTFGGIRIVERANMVLVPALLLILLFMFGWSLTRNLAEVGVIFIFTLNPASFADPNVYFAAAGQNAFDTGAGMTVLLVYATYMPRSAAIARYSLLIPIVNNLVSLFTAIIIYCAIFSILIESDGTMTRLNILSNIQDSGPGSTGVTFIWYPVLLSRIGVFGRFLCFLFFLCLSFAGISSLLADLQVVVKFITELGVPHRHATIGALSTSIVLGIPSSLSLNILENQDDAFGYALIISGCLLALMVICYNPMRFRWTIINQFGTNDWKVPKLWVATISVAVPVQGGFLILWWIYDYINRTPNWHHFTHDSVLTIFLEWGVIMITLLLTNFLIYRFRPMAFADTMKVGCDPHDESTYLENVIVLKVLDQESSPETISTN